MKLFNQHLILLFILLSLSKACTNPLNKNKSTNSIASETLQTQESKIKSPPTDSLSEQSKHKTDLLLPEGYLLFDKIKGELNGDSLPDQVLIVKGTKKESIIQDEYRGEVDRNRRGILIYFQSNGKNDLIIKHLDCFSSENEDGGVYFPPKLSVEIADGKLLIHYHHGRYGYWTYTFRYKNADFQLIGYDCSENYGPIIKQKTSINFLTKKKLIRKNVNRYTKESGEEIFEEKWEKIKLKKLHQLSEIKDFDSFKTLLKQKI